MLHALQYKFDGWVNLTYEPINEIYLLFAKCDIVRNGDGICQITALLFCFLYDNRASGNNILYTTNIRMLDMPRQGYKSHIISLRRT